MISEQDGECERAFQPGQHGLHRIFGRLALLHLFGDQMDHHLGIGLAFEGASALLQLAAQRLEILDDAIVDDGDRAAGMRVRVVDGRRAMRGPARVRDPGGARCRLVRQLGRQIAQLALGPAAFELTVMDGADAGRIIAAIFQPFQPIDQPIGHIAASEDSDNTAHGKMLSL